MMKIRHLAPAEGIAATMIVGAVLLAIALAIGLADLAAVTRSVVLRDSSMEPSYSQGSLLLVQSLDAGAVRPGDVLAIRTSSGILTRRVLAVDAIDSGRLMTLKADAASEPEAWGAMFSGDADIVRLAVPLAGYLTDGWRVAVTAVSGTAGVALIWAGTVRIRRLRTLTVAPFPAIEPATQIRVAL